MYATHEQVLMWWVSIPEDITEEVQMEINTVTHRKEVAM